MTWTLTGDVTAYLADAGDLLRSQAAENTVLLTAAETLRVRGAAAFGETPPLLGWWAEPGSAPAAAFLHTPPYGLALTAMTEGAAAALADTLADRGRAVAWVDGDGRTAPAFAVAWRARTGQPFRPKRRSRLYRLTELRAPDPAPPGSARIATAADRDVLIAWLDEFHREVGSDTAQGGERMVDDRLSYGGLTLWEHDGVPVSLAGVTRQVAGQVRVGPVYTPPGRRRRGFGGAATVAVTAAALAAGAAHVMLFTDLANPTSNALYQRLGYRPVADRLTLAFGPAPR